MQGRIAKSDFGSLNGPRGLLVAILMQALMDADSSNEQMRAEARSYFVGPAYEHHLALLGLPADAFPQIWRESEGRL